MQAIIIMIIACPLYEPETIFNFNLSCHSSNSCRACLTRFLSYNFILINDKCIFMKAWYFFHYRYFLNSEWRLIHISRTIILLRVSSYIFHFQAAFPQHYMGAMRRFHQVNYQIKTQLSISFSLCPLALWV